MFGASFFGKSFFGASFFGPAADSSTDPGGGNSSDTTVWSTVNLGSTIWTTVT
jgi:hypothetical protein